VAKLRINGSDAIGTFGYVTNEIGILSNVISKEEERIIKETLQLENYVKMTIANVPTVGIFIIGKGDTILVPSIISDEELKALEELFKVKDETFVKAGKIGLWTKADAVSYFDDFKIKILK